MTYYLTPHHHTNDPDTTVHKVQFEMFTPTPMWFDGSTYNSDLDEARLTRQINRVWRAVNNGGWHTLSSLCMETGVPEASISARLRDFRKPRFGGHVVLRERVNGGLWRYKLVVT